MAHDVFISHSSKDKTTADAICHALEQNGVRCWIAPRDVRGGRTYAAEIIAAIEGCAVLVLLFSENSNVSEDVKNEIQNAFSAKKIIIPYRMDDSQMDDEMRYFLSRKHWIDAYPDDTVFHDLVVAVKNSLGRGGEAVASQPPESAPEKETKPADHKAPVKTPPRRTKTILGAAIALVVVVGLVFGGIALWGNRGGPVEPSSVTDGGGDGGAATNTLSGVTLPETSDAPSTSAGEAVYAQSDEPLIIDASDLHVTHSPLTEEDYYMSGEGNANTWMMAQRGEWLYYRGHNGNDVIFKIRPNGEDISTIGGNTARIKTWGDYIYFINWNRSNRLYRIDANDNLECVIDAYIDQFFWITYGGIIVTYDSYETTVVHLYDFNGNELQSMTMTSPDFDSNKSYLFYTVSEGGANTLYRCDFDFSNKLKLCDDSASIIDVTDDYVYYNNLDFGGAPFRVSVSGGTPENLTSKLAVGNAPTWASSVDGDTIYFSSGFTIMSLSISTNKIKTLAIINNCESTFSEDIGNWIYIELEPGDPSVYGGDAANSYLCRLKKDGSVFETIAEFPAKQ